MSLINKLLGIPEPPSPVDGFGYPAAFGVVDVDSNPYAGMTLKGQTTTAAWEGRTVACFNCGNGVTHLSARNCHCFTAPAAIYVHDLCGLRHVVGEPCPFASTEEKAARKIAPGMLVRLLKESLAVYGGKVNPAVGVLRVLAVSARAGGTAAHITTTTPDGVLGVFLETDLEIIEAGNERGFSPPPTPEQAEAESLKQVVQAVTLGIPLDVVDEVLLALVVEGEEQAGEAGSVDDQDLRDLVEDELRAALAEKVEASWVALEALRRRRLALANEETLPGGGGEV